MFALLIEEALESMLLCFIMIHVQVLH